MDLDFNGGNKRVHNRQGGQSTPNTDGKNQRVCYHWRAGKCNRFPCPFLHRELPTPAQQHGFSNDSGFSRTRRGSNFNDSSGWGRGGNNGKGVKRMEKLCNYWVQGHCSYGDNCRYLHSWSSSDAFSLLTQLEGHQKLVTGIALPFGSDKLYTGSKDETVRVWDCQSGQGLGVLNLGGDVGCMIREGPWIFIGIPNLVKAWNTQTNADLSLNGPVGQVYALVVGHDLLFAGTQDGSILAWKFNNTTCNFEPAASLKGHTVTVVSLVVGSNRLYSGSMDHSIKVWNLENLQCIQTLTEHTSVVMSVLCWEQFLLSCSLDNTIKVWVGTESGKVEVTYTHDVEHGGLTLCGMYDLEGKPMLLYACNDSLVRIYDLPSFSERGKLFTKGEVHAIQTGPTGIFFTGDKTGEVRVWNCVAESMAVA